MKTTKLFEITFNEPWQDWLSADNLKVILDAALTVVELPAEFADPFPFKIQVRDLTNREVYIEKFNLAVKVVTEEEEQQKKDIIEVDGELPKQDIDVQKRNDEIKARLEKSPAPPHNAPGKGTPCKSPELLKEKLSTGGSISFCPSCGFQYSDTDLLDSVK